MKLYRIIHKSVIDKIWDRPQTGAYLVGEHAYLTAFGSFSIAVLEHPFYKLVLGFPGTFYVATYQMPVDLPMQITEAPDYLYQEHPIGYRKLGGWVRRFLQDQPSLVGEFQSCNWPKLTNFVINVCHPQFENVIIEDISAVR